MSIARPWFPGTELLKQPRRPVLYWEALRHSYEARLDNRHHRAGRLLPC